MSFRRRFVVLPPSGWKHIPVLSARVPFDTRVNVDTIQIVLQIINHLFRCDFVVLGTTEVHLTLDLVGIMMRGISVV
jgi:hypothetical protein